VTAHGGFFIAEAPPGRGKDSRFPIPGRESHTPMFDHPSILDARSATNATVLHFDQCMTRDDPSNTPQKTTSLLVSPNKLRVVRHHFARLVCAHDAGTHPSIAGLGGGGGVQLVAMGELLLAHELPLGLMLVWDHRCTQR
jgi:hypothetical protein